MSKMIKKFTKVIGIRVDGGNRIGYGHLTGCKALADTLTRKTGCKIIFFYKHLDENSLARISDYEIVNLSSSAMKSDIHRIKSYNIDILIVDVMEFVTKQAKQFNDNFKCINKLFSNL